MKINIIKNILEFEDLKVEVKFPWPIAELLEFDTSLVVRLEPESGVIFNENIYGVSFSGQILWQIKKVKHIYNDSPYTKIIKLDNSLKVFNWDGDEFIINPLTGEILEKSYNK